MSFSTIGTLSETRRNNFDFLRFFFASLVILTHAYSLVTPSVISSEPLARVTDQRLSFGSLAVDCFFCISGFLITQSWLREPKIRPYAEKRLLRVYPGWITALLFCIFVVGPLLRPDHSLQIFHPGTYGFLSQLVLHQAGQLKLLPGIADPVNGSTWTIPFELMCYVMVAIFGLFGLFRRPFFIFILAAVILFFSSLWPLQILGRAFHPAAPHPVPYYRWAFMICFLSGSLFFLFRNRVPHSPWLLAVSVLVMGLTLGHLPLAGFLFVLLPLFGFYILFYLAFLPVGRLYAWAKRGDLSFGIYLYAYPLQRLLVAGQAHGYHLTPLTLFLAAWALACGAAILSWRFVERPFLRLKPKSALLPAEDAGVPAVPAAGAPSA